MRKPIQIFGVGITRKVSEEVIIFGPWTYELVDEMIKTCAAENGVGLAAPQLGIYKRIIVAKTNDGFVGLVNPKIIARSKETYKVKEGCLSLPGYSATIERHEAVTVMGQQVGAGEVRPACTFECSGLAAQIFQHECDHLDGVFFIDHLSSLKRSIIEKKLVKEMARYTKADPLKMDPAQKLRFKRLCVQPQ